VITLTEGRFLSLPFLEQELKEKHRNRSASRPSANNSCVDDVDETGSGIGLSGNIGDVFLLTLPAVVGSNGSKGEDVHAMFRHWIQSVGCRVHDISDPEQVRGSSINDVTVLGDDNIYAQVFNTFLLPDCYQETFHQPFTKLLVFLDN
jgi:hypothetical protein